MKDVDATDTTRIDTLISSEAGISTRAVRLRACSWSRKSLGHDKHKRASHAWRGQVLLQGRTQSELRRMMRRVREIFQ